MLEGIFVYKRDDEKKLEWFMTELQAHASRMNIKITPLSDYNIICGYIEGKFTARSLKMDVAEVDFVINYARNPQLSRCFELMGIRVLNDAEVCALCADKSKMHFAVNTLGIKSTDTYFVQKTGVSLTHFVDKFPLVIKTTNGHGGDNVYLTTDSKELVQKIGLTNDQDYLIQTYIKNYNATDIRVFVLGGKIVGAIKRLSQSGYKTNYSKGSESLNYTLNSKEIAVINKIIKLYNFDMVGIDFIIGYGDEWFFNEIEDAITGRELFDVANISLPERFIEYIAKNVKKKK